MRTLTDPILNETVRIIERHPDLNPAYKSRIITGLDAIDRDLEQRRAVIAPEPEAPAAKAGKR